MPHSCPKLMCGEVRFRCRAHSNTKYSDAAYVRKDSSIRFRSPFMNSSNKRFTTSTVLFTLVLVCLLALGLSSPQSVSLGQAATQQAQATCASVTDDPT